MKHHLSKFETSTAKYINSIKFGNEQKTKILKFQIINNLCENSQYKFGCRLLEIFKLHPGRDRYVSVKEEPGKGLHVFFGGRRNNQFIENYGHVLITTHGKNLKIVFCNLPKSSKKCFKRHPVKGRLPRASH